MSTAYRRVVVRPNAVNGIPVESRDIDNMVLTHHINMCTHLMTAINPKLTESKTRLVEALNRFYGDMSIGEPLDYFEAMKMYENLYRLSFNVRQHLNELLFLKTIDVQAFNIAGCGREENSTRSLLNTAMEAIHILTEQIRSSVSVA